MGQAFKFLDSTADKLQLVRLVGNLLEAVKQVPALQQVMGSPPSQREILERVIALATSYLSLNPTGTMSAGQPLKFLETLAQPRTDAILSQGAVEFQAFLADTSTYTERRRLLEMEIKALQAAKQVQLTSDLPGLRQQMSDVTFINALATTSKTYASFNFSSPPAGDTPLNGFLDTLYRAQTPAEINQAGTQLDAFLHDPSNEGVAMFGADAAKRVQLIDFTTNLLKAAKQVPSLSQPAAQSVTLKELVELGRAYAALDPVADGATSQDPQLFLNTLWMSNNIQKGISEFESTLEIAKNRFSLLSNERKVLQALSQLPVERRDYLRDTSFLKDVWDGVSSYVLEREEFGPFQKEYEPSEFLARIWNSQTLLQLQSSTEELNGFISIYIAKNLDQGGAVVAGPGNDASLILSFCNLNPEVCESIKKQLQCAFLATIGKPCATSQKGIDFLAKHESRELTAYDTDGANTCTIGYGHVIYGAGVPCTGNESAITPLRAVELLRQDLRVAESDVRQYVKAPLNQNQFDALVSFAFNIGGPQLSASDVVKILNQAVKDPYNINWKKYEEAAKRMETKYRSAPGLVQRRKDEADLFRGKI